MAKQSAPMPVDDYQSESDHGTLARAEDIKASPQRMAGVKKHHKKVGRQMGKVGKLFGKR